MVKEWFYEEWFSWVVVRLAIVVRMAIVVCLGCVWVFAVTSIKISDRINKHGEHNN